jgi:hypothetical protein
LVVKLGRYPTIFGGTSRKCSVISFEKRSTTQDGMAKSLRIFGQSQTAINGWSERLLGPYRLNRLDDECRIDRLDRQAFGALLIVA